MITVDTITDEQIRHLVSKARVSSALWHACMKALGCQTDRSAFARAINRAESRARVCDLYNSIARAEVK